VRRIPFSILVSRESKGAKERNNQPTSIDTVLKQFQQEETVFEGIVVFD